jgi:hypothetical protein
VVSVISVIHFTLCDELLLLTFRKTIHSKLYFVIKPYGRIHGDRADPFVQPCREALIQFWIVYHRVIVRLRQSKGRPAEYEANVRH